MCDHCGLFNMFPAMVVGGPTGDYFIEVPVESSRWAEYQVVSIANGAQAATVVVSGDDKPIALPYDGSKTLSNDAFIRGQCFSVPASTTIRGDTGQWDRITHSQKRVFIRIDSAVDKSTYVTIRFRSRLLTIIPGPTETTHPDLGHQMNIQRANRINEHVEKTRAGIPEGEWHNA
jgi:hypothetical protein